MSGWSARRVGFVRGICLLCRLLCIIIAQADASQDHCEKNKSHLLKEIFLICHVQGQDVPKRQKILAKSSNEHDLEALDPAYYEQETTKKQFSDTSPFKSS